MASAALCIRAFEARDQAAARRLILEGLGGHFGFIDETRNPDLDDIWSYYVEPGHVFLVAVDENEQEPGNEREGKIIGTGALVKEAQGVGRIVRVSVDSAQRRRGIGKAIVRRLLEIARQRGYRRIVLETNDDWEDAIGLYRALGFSEDERGGGGVHMSVDM